jgi:magnesium-transporting ATPase (P-type)
MQVAGYSQAALDIERLAQCPLDQLYKLLEARPEGLSTSDVEKKLREHGPNVLPEVRRTPITRKVIAQLTNLFNVLLVFAAVLSFITGYISNDAGSIEMGVAILFVVVASVLFSIYQEHRAERAVEALRRLVPENVRVLRDGKTTRMAVSRIVPGDVIVLEDGDRVPADARLVIAFEISVDNSILTGESEPQPRGDSCSGDRECEVQDLPNIVLAGTIITSGTGMAVVLATGGKTHFGQVVGIARAVEEPLSPLQREVNHTAKLGFIAAIAIGIVFLLIALEFMHLRLSESLLFMIGVMVCLVPEGLQVTLTLALAISSLAMSKRNVVVKRLSAVETLGSTTVICTDKTGTITEGQMTVRMAWMGGRSLHVSGEGYEPEGKILLSGREVKASDLGDLRILCEIAALDNKATLVPPLDKRKYRWSAVGDSTDAALLVLAAKAGIDPKKTLEEQPRVGMIPFDSRRKMMTSVHQRRGVVTAYVKGAGNEILERCETALWGDKTVPMTPELSGQVRSQIDAFAQEAYRVIALAVRTLPEAMPKYDSASVETHLTFVGLVAILDPPRRDAAQAVQKARSAGIKIVMLTGDHELTAAAIARKVGIITSPDGLVMSSERLVEKSDEEISELLDTEELVFARITPEQKLRIVRLLKKKGETVAVTGDGVNDAPALLEADIGIAMGIAGTDVARESSDMVLIDDNFASIVGGVEVGRSVFDNLRKFIVYVFSHNWAELVTFIVFVMLQTPLPLAVVGVLTIDLLLEIPPSLSLTIEPPEPGILERPPRSRKSRLLDLRTLARSCYIGTLTGLVAIVWCFSVWNGAGWSIGMPDIADKATYLRGTTVVLVGIMAGQLGNLFASRTSVRSTFSLGFTRNKWLLPSLAVEFSVLLAIVYLPFFQSVFGTRALEPIQWLYLLAFAPVILLLEEARKLVLRATLPAPLVHLPSPVTLTSQEEALTQAAVRRPMAPFKETGPPLVMLSFSSIDMRDALPVAIGVAEQSGSKVLIASDRKLPESFRKFLSSESNVESQYIGLKATKGSKGMQSAAKAIKRHAERAGSEMIVLPVSREVFAGRNSRKKVGWIEEFSGRRVILVSGPPKRTHAMERPRRLLLPVLDEFHPEPFVLAGALTSSSTFPDVDVVAAKVIQIPQTIPLYSTYRPESLVDAEKELSFLKPISGLPILHRLSSRILLVRNTVGDLIDFAEKRRVDLIILRGDWSKSRHGFLPKRERRIAARAHCAVAVLMPAAR